MALGSGLNEKRVGPSSKESMLILRFVIHIYLKLNDILSISGIKEEALSKGCLPFLFNPDVIEAVRSREERSVYRAVYPRFVVVRGSSQPSHEYWKSSQFTVPIRSSEVKALGKEAWFSSVV